MTAATRSQRRLVLLALAGLAIAAAPGIAQERQRKHRIGILNVSGRSDEEYYRAFHQRLRELRFVEGANLVVEQRSASGRPERLPELARQLAGLRCDVLVAPGNEAVLAALEQASATSPIVVIAVDYDPQATGHVASLARPGGRITGVSAIQSILPAKRLELLKEFFPKATTVAVLSDTSSSEQLAVARDASRRLGMHLEVIEFKQAPYDYERAFADAVRHKADALLVLGSANFVAARPLIGKLANQYRLPSMFHHSVWAEAGGLISYGPNFSDLFRSAAEYVVEILQGKRPAELPIGQPTRLELVINMRTAKALGATLPQAALVRADRIIQ